MFRIGLVDGHSVSLTSITSGNVTKDLTFVVIFFGTMPPREIWRCSTENSGFHSSQAGFHSYTCIEM